MQCTSGKYVNEAIRFYCLRKTHRLHATMPKARFQCLKSVGFCTNSNSAMAFSKSLSLHSLLAYLKLESNLTKKDMENRNQSQHTMTVMSSTTFLSLQKFARTGAGLQIAFCNLIMVVPQNGWFIMENPII